MSGRDKWVRRFSVDETARHKNGFTIYKITSVLFPIASPEAVTVVSVWKRYSDVRRLHKSMVTLHAGLHLRGTCPQLLASSYFRRFRREVIEERAKAIKQVLEFVAEHRLLFTSTEFVHFLQSGYDPPGAERPSGVIDAIRAALQLPTEPVAPLEYPSDDSRPATPRSTDSRDETDLASIPQIPIYEAANVEIKPSPTPSFSSLNSLDSLDDDLYDKLNKLTVENKKSAVKKKTMLPDLINFDAPSSSRFEDYHTMPRSDESLSSTSRSESRASIYSKTLSLSNVESKTRTEDSYVFEAGYMLNLAARCEDAGDYQRAFECYKSGIEKMLIGVQTDSDPQRRALIKEKTNKYLSYAEQIYKNHLSEQQETLLLETSPARHWSPPASMLSRPYAELSRYRALAVLSNTIMLVLRAESACYAMKVIQKIPNNLTEFDEYFLQRTNETRQPVLPTNIPYMVPLQAYIETNNLIFLILTYAPGEKLFDYIKNYVKSVPTTPARELNLENVFSEPLKKDVKSDNDVNSNNEMKSGNDVKSDNDLKSDDDVKGEQRNEGDDDDIEVLVKNSQQLLQNVDRVLKVDKIEIKDDVGREQKETESGKIGGREEDADNNRKGGESPAHFRLPRSPRAAIPPSAIRAWGAQLLLAVDSLHNAGVICRDLNPSNILLGDGGQILLTYFPGYSIDVTRTKLSQKVAAGHIDLFAAPELYDICGEDDKTCDYWSVGAVMYQLLCGVPLSGRHRALFTRHTLLAVPDDLPVEEESLLTQLLTYDPAERLGRDGVEEIKQHPYFRHIDWDSVRDGWIVPG